MTTPIMPHWAVEECDADSTDTTEVVDYYGPSHFPVPSIAMHLVQRSTTRDDLALHEPTKVVMIPDGPYTYMDAAGLRALALAALDLADQLDALPYAPTEDFR
ncbi:hypothetical protein MYP14_04770 [Rhodococcus pyridinivorans]|uniref:hypothetical protein n=1 Tax=Rhodococcus pyridinivorans TaxID=103816 RepID=UPI001FFE543E|nr:hypothetical protein [Rhodococcus pyridinivorans]UPK64679.1 hypothetical protein MYP14_04770 [Rhodococcus pyridinivorans]